MSQVRWYVSSSHRSSAEARHRPYGIRHARQVGSRYTECGQSALNWPMFWEMPFEAETELACLHCVNAIVHQLHGSAAVGARRERFDATA